MTPSCPPLARLARHCRLWGLAISVACGLVLPAQAQDATALRARDAALRDALASNAFQRPLVLESIERPDSVQGDIHARIDQPFAVVGAALQGIDHWCEILMLHLNVKQCRTVDAKAGDVLEVVVGQKYDQALAQAYHFEFAYQVVASRPDYLQLLLSADEGPLGTSHYRIVIEVAALDGGRSMLHMSYSYGYGLTARLAMQVYLSTIGRNKVGFSVIGRTPEGQPQYIGGTRGVVERNTMRYYLAIEAYLASLSLPPAQRVEKRLADWHSGVERYPAQLHELDRDEYLALKREQMRRP